MLDLNLIRNEPDRVEELLRRKGFTAGIRDILELDAERRAALTEFERKRAEQKKLSKRIGALRKTGADASDLMREASELAAVIKDLEAKAERLGRELKDRLLRVPNVPDPDVPVSEDESGNEVLSVKGEPPRFDFEPKAHWDLLGEAGLLDMELGSSLAGSGFYALRGGLARLERALIDLMIRLHTEKHGYEEVATPYLARDEILEGTGQLPKFADDMYRIEGSELFLIPTAEVTLANARRGKVLKEDDLPIYLCGYTPCFRREAGAAGRETRGLIRVHQFSKVELIKIVRPEDSEAELEKLVGEACAVLDALGLHYRTVLLSTGDMTFSSAKTIDIEVYCPGVDRWLEVSSCSNCRDFQARRMMTRYKPAGGKGTRYVHILNGSGVALPRLLIALTESYQRADGSIALPEALRPYFGGAETLPRKEAGR